MCHKGFAIPQGLAEGGLLKSEELFCRLEMAMAKELVSSNSALCLLMNYRACVFMLRETCDMMPFGSQDVRHPNLSSPSRERVPEPCPENDRAR